MRVKILDAKKAATELKKVRKELEDTTGASEGHGKASHKQAGGVEHVTKASHKLRSALSYGAALTGLGAVGYGLKDIVQGGLHAQEQQALLQQALKTTGQQGSGHLEKINKALERSETHGGFGVVEETEAVGQLLRRTQDVNKALKLNAEAVTFARGAHMDYATAIKMVSQIQTGNTGRLQKYLGIIQPVTSHVDALRKRTKQGNEAVKEQIALYKRAHPGVLVLGSALKEVNKKTLQRAQLLDKEATAQKGNEALLKKYGGATDVYSKTAQGSISNANNAFKLATEELGQKTLPAVTAAAQWFAKLITSISQGHGAWGTLERDAGQVAGGLKEVWRWFERNEQLAKSLGIALGGVFAYEKVAKFGAVLKGLNIAKLLTGAKMGAGAEAAGTDLGGLFGKTFIAAAVGAGIYEFLKNTDQERPLEEAWDAITGQEGKLERNRAKGQKTERQQFLRSPRHLKDLESENRRAGALAGENPYRNIQNPGLRHRAEAQDPLHYFHPQAGLGDIKPIHLHLHLDGKEIAHSVGDHAIKDQKVARKLAEGAHGYTLRQKTHG